MFDITMHKGFHITFANGYTASVQWGYGNYCDNRSIGRFDGPVPASKTAEVACWGPDGNMLNIWGEDHHEDVKGWMTADDVAEFLAQVAALNKAGVTHD